MWMPFGNEKEHQKGQKKQGKRQKEINPPSADKT
jgi:hypothetical protein